MIKLFSPKDKKSKAIIKQMRKEEKIHSIEAKKAGAEELPEEIKVGMSLFAKIMTKTSYYI